MNPQAIFTILQLADLAANTAAKLYAQLTGATGKSVEELRAERDALSAETLSIIDAELQALKANE